MNDDIVTRLRTGEMAYDDYDLAADEIERLRTSGKELLDALIEMSEKSMLPKITFRLRDAAQTFEQAVRGGL